MSKNIKQIYDANPITSNASTDLMYFGQSPYTTGDDAAMLYSDFVSQGVTPTKVQSSAYNFAVDSSSSANTITLALNPSVGIGTIDPTGVLLISFSAANTNTGTTTLQVDSISSELVTAGYQHLEANDILIGQTYFAILYFDLGIAAARSVLLNPSASSVTNTQVQRNAFNKAYAGLVSPNNYDAAGASALVPFSPAMSAMNQGQIFAVTFQFDNTGPVTLISDGTLTAYGVKFRGNNLVNQDILATETYFLMWNGDGSSTFEILNPNVSLASTASSQSSSFNIASDTGAADAYAIALTPPIGAYTNGLQVAFTPANGNLTTTPTLAVNGLAAKTIVKSTGAVLVGSLTTSMIASCIYSTAAGAFVLLTPAL